MALVPIIQKILTERQFNMYFNVKSYFRQNEWKIFWVIQAKIHSYETEDRVLKRGLFGNHHQSVSLRANKIIQSESVTTWAEVQYYSGEHQLIKGRKVQRNVI